MKTVAELLKGKTVTATYNLLSDYIYQSLISFMEQNKEGYKRAAETLQTDSTKSVDAVICNWSAAVLELMLRDLGKRRKQFLRLTKKNLEKNFGGNSND
jgi:hypothetical protein